MPPPSSPWLRSGRYLSKLSPAQRLVLGLLKTIVIIYLFAYFTVAMLFILGYMLVPARLKQTRMGTWIYGRVTTIRPWRWTHRSPPR